MSDIEDAVWVAHDQSIWRALLGASVNWIDAAGVRTRCVEAGSGVPVIMLHGMGGHAETYTYNLIPLSATFRVISIDMIGHGFTDKPEIPYVIPDYTRHLLDLMDALEIEAAHIVGESLGGWVAAWTGLEAPDRVLSVVNCTGGGFRFGRGPAADEEASRAVMMKARDKVTTEVTPESVRQRMDHLFYRKELISREILSIRYHIYSQPGYKEHYKRLSHLLPYDSPTRIEHSLTEDRLRSIVTPTLYLWTDHNPGVNADTARKAHEMTANSDFYLMKDCAHWPQWENPEEFNDVVRGFMSDPAQQV